MSNFWEITILFISSDFNLIENLISCLSEKLNRSIFNLQLESDFNLKVKELVDLSKLTESIAADFPTLFQKTWPSIASKIIDHCLKSRI